MAIKLIDAQTAAVTSAGEVYGIRSLHSNTNLIRMPATITAFNLQTGENIVLQISYDGGTNFHDMYLEGNLVQLCSTANTVTIYGPGVYRVVKPVTLNAVTVSSLTIAFP
jgi:hypothetical protein